MSDAASEAVSYDEVCDYNGIRGSYKPTMKSSIFRAEVVHLFSLLHAVSMHYLLNIEVTNTKRRRKRLEELDKKIREERNIENKKQRKV